MKWQNNTIRYNIWQALQTSAVQWLEYFCKLLVLLTSFAPVLAQNPSPLTKPDDSRLEILHADSLVGVVQNGVLIRKLVGNVRLKQKNTIVNCMQANLNELTNEVEAFGKVRITQGDSLTLTGDTAMYYGSTKQARLSGKTVTMNDRVINLTTKLLDYDLNTGVAVYSQNGKVIDKANTLTSREGVYNTRTKTALFKHNVRLIGKSEEDNKPFNLSSDSLRYTVRTKTALFIAPTRIISDKDTVFAKSGVYDTRNRSSYFDRRTTIRTEDYDITGDTLFYDKNSEKGLARGNVTLVSRKDETILYGQFGDYDGKIGKSKVYGSPLMKSVLSKDTLYLRADTLISVENKSTKVRKLFAFKHVLIYKTDLQARCDSLIYNTSDSTIFFYQKPIIWNDGNQSEADSIEVQLVHNKVNTMYLKNKSFVIATDTIKNFNQVKGRKITAYFNKDSKLEKVFVEGNGESVYYALDDQYKMIGMNRVQCSKMNLSFLAGRMKRIAFNGKPDGKFFPPPDITNDNKLLPNFSWRIAEKPTKQQVIGGKLRPELPTTNPNSRPPQQRPTLETKNKPDTTKKQ